MKSDCWEARESNKKVQFKFSVDKHNKSKDTDDEVGEIVLEVSGETKKIVKKALEQLQTKLARVKEQTIQTAANLKEKIDQSCEQLCNELSRTIDKIQKKIEYVEKLDSLPEIASSSYLDKVMIQSPSSARRLVKNWKLPTFSFANPLINIVAIDFDGSVLDSQGNIKDPNVKEKKNIKISPRKSMVFSEEILNGKQNSSEEPLSPLYYCTNQHLNVYDLKTDQVTSMYSWAINVSSKVLILDNSSVLVTGGHTIPNNAMIIDTSSQICENLNSMNDGRGYHAIIQYKNKAMVLGGWGETGFLNSVEHYCEDRWIRLPPLAVKRRDLAATVYNDSVFVVGGEGNQLVRAIEEFNGKEWSIFPLELPKGLCSIGLFVFKNYLLILGGAGGNRKRDHSEVLIISLKYREWRMSKQLQQCATFEQNNWVIYDDFYYGISCNYKPVKFRLQNNN